MADVFDAEVVTLKVSEGAAYGAALQALWCWRLSRGDKVSISDLTDRFVELNKAETAEPNSRNAGIYRDSPRFAGRDVAGAARRVCETPPVRPEVSVDRLPL
jgi:xylulokinase